MKKLLLLITTITLNAAPLFAQPEKGDWITSVQGSFGAAGLKSQSYKYHYLEVKPELLKLLKHNVAVGFLFGLDQQKTRIKNYQPGVDLTNRELHFEAGPIIRKYIGSGKLRPYGELSAGFQYSGYYSKFSGEAGSSFNTTDAFIRPAIGLSYWVNDKVGFNISAGTDLMKRNYRELEINLGISVKLGK